MVFLKEIRWPQPAGFHLGREHLNLTPVLRQPLGTQCQFLLTLIQILHLLRQRDRLLTDFPRILQFPGFHVGKGMGLSIHKLLLVTGTAQLGTQEVQSRCFQLLFDILYRRIVVGDNLVSDIDRRLTYGQITEDLRKAVVSSVEEFFTFLFDMHRNNKEFLTTKLGADGASLNIVKDFCLGSEGKQVLEDALSKGYNKKFKEVNEEKDKALEDTLFFYPLVGLLHDLAWKLSH